MKNLKIYVGLVVLIGVVYFFRDPIFALFTTKKRVGQNENEAESELQNQIDNTQANDEGDNPEASITPTQAQTIANGQLTMMNQFNIDEDAMYDALKNLNGNDLRLVYESFGVQPLEGLVSTNYLDLFGWYSAKLDNSYFGGMGWNDASLSDVPLEPNCGSYWDNCTEVDYMRAIWWKSGLTLNF